MNEEQRTDFLDSLSQAVSDTSDEDVDDDTALKLPAMLPNETVAGYRNRNKDAILRRSKRLRSLEEDILGDDMALFRGGEQE